MLALKNDNRRYTLFFYSCLVDWYLARFWNSWTHFCVWHSWGKVQILIGRSSSRKSEFTHSHEYLWHLIKYLDSRPRAGCYSSNLHLYDYLRACLKIRMCHKTTFFLTNVNSNDWIWHQWYDTIQRKLCWFFTHLQALEAYSDVYNNRTGTVIYFQKIIIPIRSY